MQSVFRTFFHRSTEGEFKIDSTAQLWQLLVKITLLKARAKGRHHTAEVRDVGAEADADADGEPWFVAAVTHEPGPLEAVMLVDQIETLLQGLPPLYCHVLDLRLQGCRPARDRLTTGRFAADRPPGAQPASGKAGGRLGRSLSLPLPFKDRFSRPNAGRCSGPDALKKIDTNRSPKCEVARICSAGWTFAGKSEKAVMAQGRTGTSILEHSLS